MSRRYSRERISTPAPEDHIIRGEVVPVGDRKYPSLYEEVASGGQNSPEEGEVQHDLAGVKFSIGMATSGRYFYLFGDGVFLATIDLKEMFSQMVPEIGLLLMQRRRQEADAAESGDA